MQAADAVFFTSLQLTPYSTLLSPEGPQANPPSAKMA